MCNRKFNVSTDKTKRIKELFQQLYLHDLEFKCKTPCTTNKYTTKLVHTTQTESQHTSLNMLFDLKLDIVHSTFKIDEQTFMTRLGGSVSSGRTLLWIIHSKSENFSDSAFHSKKLAKKSAKSGRQNLRQKCNNYGRIC